MVIVMSIYSISYIMESPSLNEGHFIKLYDKDHHLFYKSQRLGQTLNLNEVSPHFLTSIVAIEDHRFYSHRGFDPIGILRAIQVNLTKGKKSEGASTISQQYARLQFLTNEKTWKRKIKEAFLTTRLETHYDKETILQGYINTVYFGHGIYGIENASQYYFNKKPIDLDLNEASMLAGVVNGPEYYSPFKDLNAAKKRQEIVLKRLVELDYIDQKTADNISLQTLKLNQDPSQKSFIHYPYFKDTVIKEMKELGFYEEKYINQGLHVETTLDSSIQDLLDQNVTKHMLDKDELEIASLVVDSHNGNVLALVGGKDYSLSQFNRATSAKRQIGSTMKPILYYIALENGFTPITKFKSEPTTFKLPNGQTYSPTNYGGKYAMQDITMAQALAVSDNIYAVKTHLFLGEQALVNILSKFGFTHVSPHPSLALGTLNTNIYELSNVYTAFANEGVSNKTHTISKITNSDGQVLYEHANQEQQLLNKDTTHILNQLMTSSFQKIFSTHANATMSSYPVKTTFAAKTGSSDFDSLCIGFNPNYTILSWTGYDDNREMKMASDSRVSKYIFQNLANTLQKEDIWYKPTKNIQQVPIDPLTGEYQENGLVYWFKK